MTALRRLVLSRSPVGPLTLSAAEGGLREVTFGFPDDLPSQEEERSFSDPVLQDARELLERYFQGEKVDFHHVPVDLSALTPFQRSVLEALRTVPLGGLTTYGELAREVGAGSPRAVGQAVGANPIPILIPCHRVVAADGRLGGYSGGLTRKVALLELEGFRPAGPRFQARLHSGAELQLPI